MTRRLTILLAVLTALTAMADRAEAQPLGTFTWRLEPFCNLVTVNVTQNGAVYTMDGYDDLCGGSQRATVVGLATPNPDGTIGIGWNIVVEGAGIHVGGRITLAGLSGPWSDSAGNSGHFVFGTATSGSPRPVPSGTSIIPPVFALLTDGGFLARGALGAGTIPASGAGTRLMWHPAKGAFRVGSVSGIQWDDANVGSRSIAMGSNTVADGGFSTAFGSGTRASGDTSTAMGLSTVASGPFSLATGAYTTAAGAWSTALGYQTAASGVTSLATGSVTRAEGLVTTVMGTYATATAAASGSFVYGDRSTVGAGSGIVTSSAPNQFLVRAAGGVTFYTNGTLTSGVTLAGGGSGWGIVSDVHMKEHFRDVTDAEILAAIARMPVRTWNYKTQDAAIRHMGPTAQDFHAAFGLGESDVRINTIDADGVALAAVKALEARTRTLPADAKALRDEIAALARDNADLRARLARLEALLDQR